MHVKYNASSRILILHKTEYLYVMMVAA